MTLYVNLYAEPFMHFFCRVVNWLHTVKKSCKLVSLQSICLNSYLQNYYQTATLKWQAVIRQWSSNAVSGRLVWNQLLLEGSTIYRGLLFLGHTVIRSLNLYEWFAFSYQLLRHSNCLQGANFVRLSESNLITTVTITLWFMRGIDSVILVEFATLTFLPN